MQLLNPALTHVFISPHFDDICFSLASYIAHYPHSYAINVFTRCNFVANPQFGLGVKKDDDVISAISHIRDNEDEIFSKAYSLSRINLGLPEATVIGRHPFDVTDIKREIEDVSISLLKVLIENSNFSNSEKSFLYCPMGIGGHRNHLSVLMAVLSNYVLLGSKFKIIFYEDLPYAANSALRDKGILQFKDFFKNASFDRHEFKLSTAEVNEKLRALNFYESQQAPKNFPESVNAYSATTISTESLWEVCQKY